MDVDPETVERLRNGETRVIDVNSGSLDEALAEGIEFTTEYTRLSNVDGVSICVPTPLKKTDTPDLSFVVDAVERLAPVISEDATIILERFVYPGLIEKVVGRALSQIRVMVDEDV